MRWMAENSMQNDRACAQAGAGCFARSFGDILVVDTMVMVSIFVILLGGITLLAARIILAVLLLLLVLGNWKKSVPNEPPCSMIHG